MPRRQQRKNRSAGQTSVVTWDRARAIFGDPRPPHKVWERQFDGFDKELRQLAQAPYDKIDFSDLWYYHHDLAYIDLQPEVFNYLFPVCLMDWHRSLMENEPCSHGDSEFHYGVHRGNVFEKMTTPEQRDDVFRFFRDSFLNRLDAERGFEHATRKALASTFGWIGRLNSLGIIMPKIDSIWEAWWSLDTPGRAVAALQYCSGLMYWEGVNRLFEGAIPPLWVNDSHIYDAGWMPENTRFLASTLTYEFVSDRVAHAVAYLQGEPEWEKARLLESDLPTCRELVEIRIAELPTLLSDPGSDGWSL